MRNKCHSVSPQEKEIKETSEERMEIDGCVEERSDEQSEGDRAREVGEEAGTIEEGVCQPCAARSEEP